MKQRRSGFSLACALAVLTFLFAARLPSQTATGSISGAVRDPTTAAVPAVKVTVTNVATNETRQTKTDNAGIYTFQLLPPATYRIEAEAAGFKRFIRDNVKVDVALALTLDLPMEIGSASDSVTVTAEVPPLEEESSSLAHIIENERIVNLPTNGRNSYGFAQLVPGVRASKGFTQVAYGMYNDQFVSINGSRPNSNSFMLDGGNNTNPAFNGPAYFPSVDEVQEYKVQTNNFSAEFSNSAGGVINLVTKSGTNQYHGSLYEFLRNDKLTGTDFFVNRSGLRKGELRFNQFGGTVGGPITIPHVYHGKDRTFFFGSYEGLRWVRGITAAGSVPTDLERAGDFSQTRAAGGQAITVYDPSTSRPDPNAPGTFIRSAFPGNIVPASRFDPVSKNLLNYIPHANSPGAPITNLNNFISNASSPVQKNGFSVRVDHSLTQNQKVFARASLNDTPVSRPEIYGHSLYIAEPINGAVDQLNQRQAVVNYTNLLRPNLILELSSSFLRYSIQRQGPGNNFDPVQVGLPAYFHQLQPALVSCFPTIGITNYGVSIPVSDVGGGLIGNCQLLHDSYESFHEYANLTHTRGKHTLKFGGNFGVNRLSTGRYGVAGQNYSYSPGFTQGPNPLVGSSTAGDAFASFLLGTPSSGSVTTNGPGQNLLYRYFGVYFQDDWKVTSRLTLNLGLRYDYQTPWTERYNRFSDFNFTAPSPLQVPGLNLVGGLYFPGVGGTPRGQFNPDRKDFAPRFGFAYLLDKNTVIRGGYGIFFAPITGGGFNGSAVPVSGFQSSSAMVTTIDGITPANYQANPFPDGFVRAPGSSAGLATLIGQSVTGMDRDRHTPYAEQWNLDVQRTLPGNLLLDVAYAGSRGLRLFGSLNYDQLPNQYLALGDGLRQPVPNPFFGKVASGPLSTPTVQLSQLLRPYPQFTGVTAGNASYGASTYHALQAKLERRFSKGFSVLVSYTFSKLLDDVSPTTTGYPGESFASGAYQDTTNRAKERAPASFDTPHYLALNSVWEIPVGPGHQILTRGVASQILGGWQLNGIATFQSGVPLQLGVASNTLNNYGGAQRPNWTGKDPTLSGPISQRLNHYFDTSQFSLPLPYTYGNVARLLSVLRAPGLANLDLSIFKNFSLRESLKLQFRIESFNTLNHPQFSLPNTTIGS
ncbi:MAG: TonB-dependent receptor, partial [Acidobacteriota bacterium]|nr:TonB-dependent receptor [Acidobacteriota bacterium]